MTSLTLSDASLHVILIAVAVLKVVVLARLARCDQAR
jgi:hypothetical protein